MHNPLFICFYTRWVFKSIILLIGGRDHQNTRSGRFLLHVFVVEKYQSATRSTLLGVLLLQIGGHHAIVSRHAKEKCDENDSLHCCLCKAISHYFIIISTLDIYFLALSFRPVSITGYAGCRECGDSVNGERSVSGNSCWEHFKSGINTPALERVPYR